MFCFPISDQVMLLEGIVSFKMLSCARANVRITNEKNKENSHEGITWSEMGKQNVQAKGSISHPSVNFKHAYCFPNSNSLKSFWYLVPSSLDEMTPRTQHLFLFIGLVNGWIIPTSTALAISWATTVLVFFSMIKQDSFYTRMESKLFIILCNVHLLETRGLFLKSRRTFRAYLGCHNSLYILAMLRF